MRSIKRKLSLTTQPKKEAAIARIHQSISSISHKEELEPLPEAIIHLEQAIAMAVDAYNQG
jgi:hypothetical protein